MNSNTLTRRALLRRATVAAVAAAAAAVGVTAAHAQDTWPTHPVKVIVPSSPGGGTLWFANNAKDASFDVRRDLTPVARGVYAVSSLIVNNDVKATTLQEFIALAKKNPDMMIYGTPGAGSAPQLGVRMMEEIAGLKFIHAPYKGIGPAYQDVIGGRIQFIFADLASALPFVQSGKVRALAVDRKTSLLPNVPTFVDAGMPKFDSPIAFSVFAPTGVPPAILNRMADEVRKALKAIAPRLEQQAYVPIYDTPSEFAASLDKERSMWREFIARNKITVDQ